MKTNQDHRIKPLEQLVKLHFGWGKINKGETHYHIYYGKSVLNNQSTKIPKSDLSDMSDAQVVNKLLTFNVFDVIVNRA